MADAPFREAIDFLAGKVNLPTQRWDDLRHAAHVRGFSVAGVNRDDMLADFFKAMMSAEKDGTGFQAFQKSFDEIVDRTGWEFKARGSTDEERRAWRARIIYTTNMRTSYMAGRYSQMMDPDVLRYRPYWQYVHSGALHPRKQHLAWDGLVLAATDPAWKVMYPPNGWGCGCDVEALSARELAALGKSAPDPSPDLKPYEANDPRTGEPVTRYAGIDRGWEYNVGHEWLHGIVPTELRKPLPPIDMPSNLPSVLPDLTAPVPISTDRLLPENLPEEDYISAFLNEFGADAKRGLPYRDVSGGIVTISPNLFEKRRRDGTVVASKVNKGGRGRYVRLIADAIKNPDEIWAEWVHVASGVALRRSYMKRFVLPDLTSVFVRFEWTKHGWIAVTGFQPEDEFYLEKYRKGALLYRKK